MSKAKKSVVTSFLKEHPESAAIVITKNGSVALKTLIDSYSAETLTGSLNALSPQLLAETLITIDDKLIAALAEKMQANLISRIFRSWIKEGKAEKANRVLSMVKSSTAKAISKLATYPENVVGSLMNPSPFTVPPTITAKNVLELLKKQQNRYSRYVYVVDEDFVLVGVLPFKDAFYADKDSLVSKLMTTNVFSLSPDLTVNNAIKENNWAKWDSLPVANAKNRLLGVIRYDTLEHHLSPQINERSQHEELLQAGKAVGEVFQIGINATASALGLMGSKK